MPDLAFEIRSAAAVPFAATPLVSFTLEVVNRDSPLRVHSGIVRCQIQLEATRRRYDAAEQERLLDLFGEPERWSTTLKPMLWTHTTFALPQFVDRAAIEVTVPCSYDFNIAATKYFDGLLAGEIPLNFLFSGTVFYEAETDQALQVAPISWDTEARFRLPVAAWRDLMEHYYPNSVWLRLHRDTFDRLAEYKRRHAIVTWEEVFDCALSHAESEAVRVRS